MGLFFARNSLSLVETQEPHYRCNTDGRWPEYLYLVNDTCLRCPSTCETCLPETADLSHPCRTCFVGHGFEPSPTARQILDSSRRDDTEAADVAEDVDKIASNQTEAEVEDPFTWFVSGSCADCHTIGKYPTSGSNRLHLTPASLTSPYEGRLEVYYYHRWWAVCDDLWSMTNTHIACAELGLGLGVSFFYEYYMTSPSPQLGPIPIAFDNIQCDLQETSLFRCQRSDFLKHNCDVSETLGIKCSGPRHRSLCVDQCPVGQWLDLQPGVCKNCSDTCLTCTSHPTLCTSCEEPYFLAANFTCLQSCPVGYYGHVIRHTCEKCGENCVTCADGATSSHCVSCDPSLVLYKGRCDAHCPGTSFWVQDEDGATCLDTCPLGYYATKAFVCKACNDNCRSCDWLPSNCTKCAPDAVLSVDGRDALGEVFGRCSKECQRGYFANAFGVCQGCIEQSCSDCYLGGEYCKVCTSGYLLQFNRCVRYCEYGLYNSSGLCGEYCPVGQYGDLTTGQCRPCQSPCKHCRLPHLCTACFNGYHLDNDQCVQSCGQQSLALSVHVESELRIVGRHSDLEGYVQIRSSDVWSYVCFQKLDIHSAQFICQSLGLGNILQVSHEGSVSGQIASFVYTERECFSGQTSFHICTQHNHTIYSGCYKQIPLLRCSGPDTSTDNKCIRLSTGPCREDMCSNLSTCVDISTNESFSYCESCPKGYQGDGFHCEKVPELSVRILFPASDVQLLNWPEGLELQLPCVVNEVQHVTIRWWYEGMEIHSNADRRVDERGLLTLFTPVGRASSGVYTCRVYVYEDMVDQRSYNVTVQERIKIIVPPENFTGSGRVNLNCVYRGYPPGHVYWKKDDHNVTTGEEFYREVSNRSLIIESVRPQHSGVYECTVRNNFTQDRATATVTVTGEPVISNKRAVVGAALGQQFVLVCVASGGPDPDIYWKKDGEDIDFSERVQFVNNDSVLIRLVEHTDGGVYKCLARNMYGQDVWITTVIVMGLPSATVYPVYIEDVIGSRVTYLCEASPQHPAPLITWYLPARGEFVQTNDSLGVEIFDGRIIIADLQEEDAGFIVCRVSNLAGSFEASVELVVKVPPRFIDSPENTTVFGGWPCHLQWTVHAVPPAEIVWYHSGRLISTNQNGFHINLSGLYFTPSWPHSEGWYTLRATHQVGYLLESAYLTLIKNLAAMSDLAITPTSITVPLYQSLGEGLLHHYVDVVLAYLGNGSHHDLIDVSPYNVNVMSCRNDSTCLELYSTSQVLYRVGLLDASVSHFTMGEGMFYSLESSDANEEVYNEELVSHSWYAISVRYFRKEDDVSPPQMVAATNYSYVFTEDTVVSVPVSGVWRTVVAVVVVLLLLLLVSVLGLWILYRKGYRVSTFIHRVIPTRVTMLCQKKETIDFDGPMDVESYLPQFSPNPSPTLKIARVTESLPSTSYTPTERDLMALDGVSSNKSVTLRYLDQSGESSHPPVVHKVSTGSKDSGSDSGFNEHVPRKVSLSTKRGETLAREVVSVLSLRHQHSTASPVHKQMLPVVRTTSLQTLKLKLSRASGYMASGVMRMRDKVTSARKSVTLVEYANEGNRSQKGKGHIPGVWYATKGEEPTQVTDSPVPIVTKRNVSGDSESLSGSDDDYIDPRSISSIPGCKTEDTIYKKTAKDELDRPVFPGSVHRLSDIPITSDLYLDYNHKRDKVQHFDQSSGMDDFDIIYELNKKILEGQGSLLNVLDVGFLDLEESDQSNETNKEIRKHVVIGADNSDKVPGNVMKMTGNEQITEQIAGACLEHYTKDTNGKALDGEPLSDTSKQSLDAAKNSSASYEYQTVGLQIHNDNSVQESEGHAIYEQLEAPGLPHSTQSDCVETDKVEKTNVDATDNCTVNDLGLVNKDAQKQEGKHCEETSEKSREDDRTTSNNKMKPRTDADDILEAFNDMLTEAECTEAPTLADRMSVCITGDDKTEAAYSSCEDKQGMVVYNRVDNGEMRSDSSSISHVYTELIPDTQQELIISQQPNNQQDYKLDVDKEPSKDTQTESDEIDQVGNNKTEAEDIILNIDQMDTESLEECAKKDALTVDQCESFLQEEAVGLYYALFPSQAVPVLGPTEGIYQAEVATVKELKYDGMKEVFSVVLPDQRVTPPQTLDTGGRDKSEFLSTYAKIKKSTAGRDLDQKKTGGTKSYIYGNRHATRMYSDHTDNVEQVKTGAKEGTQFVMSDMYKHKPPQKLDIPQIFQK